MLLTDTIAHRRLADSLAGACRLVTVDAHEIARELHELVENPRVLVDMRNSAWNLGTSRWNWEVESSRWIEEIRHVLSLAS